LHLSKVLTTPVQVVVFQKILLGNVGIYSRRRVGGNDHTYRSGKNSSVVAFTRLATMHTNHTMKGSGPRCLMSTTNVIRASCLCFLGSTLATILVVFTISRYEDSAIVDKIVDLVKQPDSGAVELALDDPSVIEASEILHHFINAYRSENCSSVNQYGRPGTVKYAKRAVLDQFAVHYSIEVAFANESIFSRFRLLPYNESNLGERRLELISSTPAPCATRIQEQLAVSALGMWTPINLWSASPPDLFPGVRISGRGDQPPKPLLGRVLQPPIRRDGGQAVRPRLLAQLRAPQTGRLPPGRLGIPPRPIVGHRPPRQRAGLERNIRPLLPRDIRRHLARIRGASRLLPRRVLARHLRALRPIRVGQRRRRLPGRHRVLVVVHHPGLERGAGLLAAEQRLG
jgi:hypothetical protein